MRVEQGDLPANADRGFVEGEVVLVFGRLQRLVKMDQRGFAAQAIRRCDMPIVEAKLLGVVKKPVPDQFARATRHGRTHIVRTLDADKAQQLHGAIHRMILAGINAEDAAQQRQLIQVGTTPITFELDRERAMFQGLRKKNGPFDTPALPGEDVR